MLGSLALMVPQTGSAQGPGPSVLWQRPAGPVAGFYRPLETDAAQAPDYRWEGMAIGAGVGALGFGLLGVVVCGLSESDDGCNLAGLVGVGLLGAFCGGIIGGVIGGAMPKEEPADSTDEVIEWGS
jgi:hypothetical protein